MYVLLYYTSITTLRLSKANIFYSLFKVSSCSLYAVSEICFWIPNWLPHFEFAQRQMYELLPVKHRCYNCRNLSHAHQLIHNGHLQRQLDVLLEWLRKWRVAINTEKSEAISFMCHWKTSVNYLDVELCNLQHPCNRSYWKALVASEQPYGIRLAVPRILLSTCYWYF